MAVDNAWCCQKKSKGQELLDKVCEHLNLLEKDYFCCSYRDNDVKVGWSVDCFHVFIVVRLQFFVYRKQ